MTEEGPGLARFYLPLTLAVLLLVILTLVVEFAAPARALPSFARQTGQPCGTCHTDFAGLTPYGRRFKINGYTNGGGQYRTTLFPFDDSIDKQRPWVPPISMMATPGFTNLTVPQPADPFAPNNNITIPPLKLEYDYYGFGTKSLLFTDTTLSGGLAPANINQNIQVVLLGVNFHARSGPDW